MLCGLLLPFAFAPFGAYLLAPLALGGLLGTVDAARCPAIGRAFRRGWLFGVGVFGFGVSWVSESFQYNHVAYPMALATTALLVAALALFPATLAAAGRWLGAGGTGWRMLAAWPAGWILLEWVRGSVLSGFTWLQIGYSQIDGPLAGLAPVVGSYGIGWVVALVAGAIGCGLARAWAAASLGAGLAGALVLASALLDGHPWSRPIGEPLPVALIQGNVAQGDKWRPENRAPTLRRYVELTRSRPEARLVVWPETAVPGFYHRMTDFLAAVEADAATRGTEILAGVPSYDRERGRPLNSVVKLGDGRGTLYNKRHLVPFGEYLPLAGLLGPIVAALRLPVPNFAPGADWQPTIRVAGQAVGISICYEAAFDHEIRRALPAARLLVNVSNDAWFGDSLAPHQHLEIARMRAAEAGRYLLRATNTGISAIVDPTGRVVSRTAQFETAVLAGEVRFHAGTTPFVSLGPAPVLAFLGVVALVAAALARSRAEGSRGRLGGGAQPRADRPPPSTFLPRLAASCLARMNWRWGT